MPPFQKTVTSSATLLVGEAARKGVLLGMVSDGVDVFIGGPDVTTTSGMLLVGARGATVPFETSAALYAITSAGSATVAVAEMSR